MMDKKEMWDQVKEAVAYLKSNLSIHPEIAVILGTGLGGFVREVNVYREFSYSEIPGCQTSTVEGHNGRLILGFIEEIPILIMQGRLHYYEGYSMDEVTFPVHVMSRLGIKTLLVSNAAGGLNPDFVPGDMMVITDHINLFPEHPLRGKNRDDVGPRFPDMGNAYDKNLIKKAELIGEKWQIPLKKGVYVGTQGPSFETSAEYRYFRLIGGDAVGMSTVPEVIVANHAGIACFGISVVANVGLDPAQSSVTHEEVQKNTEATHAGLALLFIELIKAIQKK